MRYHGHTMDVERTIQFILDHQAKHEIEMAAIRQTLAENHARHETEMADIRQTLVETTQVQLEQARVLVRIEEAQHQLTGDQRSTEQKLNELASALKELAGALKELAGAQQVTEQKLQNFIDNLGRSTNGH